MWQLRSEDRAALEALSRSRLRAEADRARAILLSAQGWPSPAIAEVVAVRADSVRRWRHQYRSGGIEALRAHRPPGRPAYRGARALEALKVILSAPKPAEAPPWTLPRLQVQVEWHTGVRLSQSYISRLLRKKGDMPAAARATRSHTARIQKPLRRPGSA